MDELPRELWPPYTTWPEIALPRNITSLDTPWVASPPIAADDGSGIQRDKEPKRRGLARILRSLRRRNHSGGEPTSFARVLHSGSAATQRESRGAAAVNHVFLPQFPSSATLPISEAPTSSEWREFAAYSRPCVNGVDVHNTFSESFLRISGHSFFH